MSFWKRFKALTSAGWTKWKLLVEWVKSNSAPIIAALVILNLFGMIATETATALRDAVLALAGL